MLTAAVFFGYIASMYFGAISIMGVRSFVKHRDWHYLVGSTLYMIVCVCIIKFLWV